MSEGPISIGDMRQKGSLMQNTPVADQSGGFSDNFSQVLTCRGRLRKSKGGKALENGEFVINKGYEWICRFQSGITVDTDTAWQIGGQIYRINDFEKVDEINQFYRFVLSIFQ